MHSLDELSSDLWNSPFFWILGGLALLLVGLGLASLYTRSFSLKVRVLDFALGAAGFFWLALGLYVLFCFFEVTNPHNFDYLILGLSLSTLATTLGALLLPLPGAQWLRERHRKRLVKRILRTEAGEDLGSELKARLDRLIAGFEFANPPLLVLPHEEAPRAWVLGGSKPIIVLTRGLVRLLSVAEFEGVAAHELAHIKLDHSSRHSFWHRFTRLLILDPVAKLAFRATCRQREFEADDLAVTVTGQPLELASALLKVARHWQGGSRPRPSGPALLTRGLLLHHPYLGERIARLLRMAGVEPAAFDPLLKRRDRSGSFRPLS